MGPKQNIFGAKQLFSSPYVRFNSYQILSNWPTSLKSRGRSHLDKTFAKREKAIEMLINKFLTRWVFCSES